MRQRRRHVFHIAGYDPIRPAQQYRRFVRELAIFQETWGARTTLSEMTEVVRVLLMECAHGRRQLDWRGRL